jgi:transcriptional regulator with XRE-family HTH domain
VSIGTRLKETRIKAGLTQVQLAHVSGVPQGLITCYENDVKIPSAPKLAALAKALHVSMDNLVDDDQRPDPEIPDGPKIHGNSRAAKVQQLFLKLDEEAQRVLLKQMKAMATPTASTEPHRRSKAA